MFWSVRGQITVAAWTAILATMTVLGLAQEVPRAHGFDVEAAALKFAGEILVTRTAKESPPFTSDIEHARSIDPVLTRETAIWIHEELPSPPLTVVGGRVFSFRDHHYDPLEIPVLKIRPIDDEQTVHFLVRVVVSPDHEIPDSSAITIAFPAPPIFNPRIERVQAWVGSKPTDISIVRSPSESMISVRIPLAISDGEMAAGPARPVVVIVQGDLGLGSYRWVAPGRFSDFETHEMAPDIAELARLRTGRDFAGKDEQEQLHRIAQQLAPKSPTSYGRVTTVNNWVSSRLRYRESPVTRSAVEALEDRFGDCGEYTTVMVALLRAMKIPARRAVGRQYDFDRFSAHAWVEVALPKRNGELHWFVADPTFASTTAIEEEKASFVQLNDRMLLYQVKPTIRLEGSAARRSSDIFINWRRADQERFSEPTEVDTFFNIVIANVDDEISSGARRLAERNLLFRRESASILGSPYVIVDRPLSPESSNQVQLRLENEERLVLDVTAGHFSEFDDQIIPGLRSAYQDLNHHFFAGEPALHNLELIYLRDRHTDRLHTVRLRFGRYLVEHSLSRILRRLSKGGFLTEKEREKITAVAETSGGRNLYLLQELARQLPAGAGGAKDDWPGREPQVPGGTNK